MRPLCLLLLAACAPEAEILQIHQTPVYPLPPARVFQAVMEAANDLYGLGSVDVPHFACVTKSFFVWTTMAHRGWAGERARGGWAIEVVRSGSGAYAVITPIAQRSLTNRGVPSWVDVGPDDVGLAPTLDVGAEKIEHAIDERVHVQRGQAAR